MQTGPRRIRASHAQQMFTAAGWKVESIDDEARIMDRNGRDGGLGGRALLMRATRA